MCCQNWHGHKESLLRVSWSVDKRSDLLHEKKAVTAEMAIRISRAVGGTPESWLRMQEALDLWTAEIKFKKNPSIAPKVLAA
ncbi:unannotated protein [freshwater metagenome]|uniref:Unannotated protein n=1 Tax=freshwater metagenome TaxID=449393 RepID=A0A6J6YIA8_9ZZZZ